MRPFYGKPTPYNLNNLTNFFQPVDPVPELCDPASAEPQQCEPCAGSGICCVIPPSQFYFIPIPDVMGYYAEESPEDFQEFLSNIDDQNDAIEAARSALEGGGWSCVWSIPLEAKFVPPTPENPDYSYWTSSHEPAAGTLEAVCDGEIDYTQEPIYNAADNAAFFAKALPDNGAWQGFQGNPEDYPKTYIYPCVESANFERLCTEVANAQECLNWRGPAIVQIPTLGCESDFFPGKTCEDGCDSPNPLP
jgi:hypothetical protein